MGYIKQWFSEKRMKMTDYWFCGRSLNGKDDSFEDVNSYKDDAYWLAAETALWPVFFNS